jgi:hypothetical protein
LSIIGALSGGAARSTGLQLSDTLTDLTVILDVLPEANLRPVDNQLIVRSVQLTAKLDKRDVVAGGAARATAARVGTLQIVHVLQVNEAVVDVLDVAEIDLTVCQEDSLVLGVFDEPAFIRTAQIQKSDNGYDEYDDTKK